VIQEPLVIDPDNIQTVCGFTKNWPLGAASERLPADGVRVSLMGSRGVGERSTRAEMSSVARGSHRLHDRWRPPRICKQSRTHPQARRTPSLGPSTDSAS
jgi:hypothetical protein